MRINLDGNKILDIIKERLYFDREAHLRTRKKEDQVSYNDKHVVSRSGNDYEELEPEIEEDVINANRNPIFNRRFINPDMATCWLNACLQLILGALDLNLDADLFDSELGHELEQLRLNPGGGSLDPTSVKDIIVTCEDTRIATRLSELQSEIFDQEELNRQSEVVQSMRLNLRSGQQCVRDFFVALKENLLSWPDVYNYLAFQMVNSTTVEIKATQKCHKYMKNWMFLKTYLLLKLQLKLSSMDQQLLIPFVKMVVNFEEKASEELL